MTTPRFPQPGSRRPTDAPRHLARPAADDPRPDTPAAGTAADDPRPDTPAAGTAADSSGPTGAQTRPTERRPGPGSPGGTVAMVGYTIGEAARNLRRNITLTVAAVITAALSLSLFGTAMLVRSGVDAATSRWQDGIEFIVFLDPAATDTQIDRVADRLDNDPQVAAYRYVDRDESYAEFVEIYADQPALAENISADILPPSFRVAPATADTTEIRDLALSYEDGDGVYQVVAALDTVRTIQNTTSTASTGMLALAFVILAVAAILIVNSIRMAVYTRRREIEVMRLVGAGNWLISAPFITEGAICGVVGGALAAAGLRVYNGFLTRLSDNGIPLLEGFHAPASEVATTSVAVVVIGAGLGVVGAALALVRHLRG